MIIETEMIKVKSQWKFFVFGLFCVLGHGGNYSKIKKKIFLLELNENKN